jgi:hypothetical protein
MGTPRTPHKSLKNKAAWTLLAGGAAALAGTLVERALNTGYKSITHEDPPLDPTKKNTSWTSAIAWAAFAGAAVAVAALVAARGADAGWRKFTHTRPPV